MYKTEEKEQFDFSATGECDYTQKLIQNEINSAVVFHLMLHEQLYQILKCLNNIPNTPTEDCEEYIDGIIEVHFPILLDPNISFTFYDTPGTDSNSNEHLMVLRKALQQQSNSILVILYEPTKMEGTGNSVLYKLINSSRESAETKDKVHIDLSRSLHIINQADTRSLNDLYNLKDKKVEISLKETDELIGVKKTTGENKVILASKEGKMVIFDEEEIDTLCNSEVKVNIENDSIIGKVFGYFFDN